MSEAAGNTSLAARITGNPWLLLTFSTLLWGGNVVAARWAVGEISPMVLVGLRWIAVCTLILCILRGRTRAMFDQLRPHWLYLLLMGVFGFTISNAALYEGARFTSGVNVAIIQGVLPVLVLAGARMVYGTRVGVVRMAGVALTMAGILLIATEGERLGVALCGALHLDRRADLLDPRGRDDRAGTGGRVPEPGAHIRRDSLGSGPARDLPLAPCGLLGAGADGAVHFRTGQAVGAQQRKTLIRRPAPHPR